MRDGTNLAANLFLPKSGTSWPVILVRTPYGKEGDKWEGGEGFATKGYAVVVQDCRGRGKSEGEWEPFLHEAQDGFDTQEWVGKQPWCNGSIATCGGSYVGWTQWAAAPMQSKYLKAMSPVVPFANTYEDFAYPGGAMQIALLMGWGELVGDLGIDASTIQASYSHLPLRAFGDQFAKKRSYFNEWAKHPTYDAYWKQRGLDYKYADVTVPTLGFAGWYDIFAKAPLDLAGGVRASSRSEKARDNQYVVVGPWGHVVGVRKVGALDFGADAELKVYSRQFQWYEHWLKGKDTIKDWPRYYLFIMGENRWRGEDEWPLKRTQFTPYYLHGAGKANSLNGDGSLSLDLPKVEPLDQFVYDGNNPVPSLGGNNIIGTTAGPEDQTEIEKREDVLVYSTPALTEDVEVTGPVKLIIWASSSATDTDFTGKLVDVHPDGKAYNICDGICRARYRNGMETPTLLTPGKPERMEVDMWVTSNLFKRGHQIRLEVASSNFPRFDRNPNSGLPFGSDTKLLPATQHVLHDADHPTHLMLPIIPRQSK